MVENGTKVLTNALIGRRRWRIVAASSVVILAAALAIIVPGTPSRRTSDPVRTVHGTQTRSVPAPETVAVAPATPAVVTPAAVTPATTPAPVTAAAASDTAAPSLTPAVSPAPVEPAITTLVAEVEAAGVEPGTNWTWSMGDTATHCGPLSGAGTGCTYGTDGLEFTVFSGTPTLALVAHELANAETQNDAVPSLLSEVATAAGTTSWSPTDAVASCLVEHFLGFQDGAAGTWQCPSALATTVADNIHDTL